MEEPIYKKLTGVYIIPKAESVISEPEKRLMAMINGEEPQTPEEAIIQKQANTIIDAGHVIEIPSI